MGKRIASCDKVLKEIEGVLNVIEGYRQVDKVKPNELTIISIWYACTELGSLKLGSLIHGFTHTVGSNLEFS